MLWSDPARVRGGDLVDTLDRSQFYTGFVAKHYDLLVPDDETGSFAYFRRAVETDGGPALELGCGTGRPLLSFVQAGLDVEGLDASADMLAICARKARELGVNIRLHHDHFEFFELERRFRTVYCVNSSFMLLPDDAATRIGLANIYRHLEPGGQVLISLEIPREPEARARDRWRTLRRAKREDGATIDCCGRLLRFDPTARVVESTLQYRELRDDQVVHEEEHDFLLHWHTQEQFAGLLREAGFTDARVELTDGSPADADARDFVFVAVR